MKKLFLALTLLVFIGNRSLSQTDNYIKKPSLSFSFTLDDFNAASYINVHDLRDAVNNHQLTNFQTMGPGLSIGYLQGFSKHFDFEGALSLNSTDYPYHANDGSSLGNGNGLLMEADASVVGKMFSDQSIFTPFLKAGLGASYYKGYWGAFIPVGVGFQIKLTPDAFALLNWQYRIRATENTSDHFFYSVGIAGSIVERKKTKEIPAPPLPIVETPKDKDGDGVVDSLDDCPDIAGLKKFKGCPDADEDGIPDKDDKCPTVPGLARYNGCLIPDTDGDGVNNEEDKCPTIPGLARYQGCPIPDTDADGVNEEDDKCPSVPGVKENQGCPLVKNEIIQKIAYSAKNIFFASGSAKLLSKSYKALNEVAKILKENESLKLDVEGNTDNIGTREKNQLLSESRAKAVMTYLQTKGGIDEKRLEALGYGDSKPIATNKTAKGRAMNRRVDLKVKYF